MEKGYSQYIESQWLLTYSKEVCSRLQEQSVKNCNGCLINHPSQKQHSCLEEYESDLFKYRH